MKTALVIFTCNASSGGRWQAVLDGVTRQSLTGVDKFVIDSSSQDDTVIIAQQKNLRCITVDRKKFNHGSTRRRALNVLAGKKYEWVFFLSQDVVIKNADALKNMLEYAINNQLAGCYGRQTGFRDNEFDAWQRSIYFGEENSIRSLSDGSGKCSANCFFSDAFCLWHIPDVIASGNFPDTDFGEDALMAAALLKSGKSVGYCAAAEAYHQHSSAWKDLFRRGWLAGKFYRQNKSLLNGLEHGRLKRLKNVPLHLLPDFFVKTVGYLLGRFPTAAFLTGVVLVMLLLLAVAVVWADIPLRDVAGRYAPMAEAFARREWQFAFHPRTTPLLPILGGVVVMLTGCDGYMGCKVAASLLLILSVFPLWDGCRRIYGTRTAVLSVILLAGSAYLMRLGYYAVRETGSLLGVVLLFDAAARLKDSDKRFSGLGLLTLGLAILLWSRGDTALFALIVFLLFFIWDLMKNIVPWRTVAAGGLLLILLFPLLMLNYYNIGYPVPEVRHALVWQKIERHLPFFKRFCNPRPRIKIDIAIENGVLSDGD